MHCQHVTRFVWGDEGDWGTVENALVVRCVVLRSSSIWGPSSLLWSGGNAFITSRGFNGGLVRCNENFVKRGGQSFLLRFQIWGSFASVRNEAASSFGTCQTVLCRLKRQDHDNWSPIRWGIISSCPERGWWLDRAPPHQYGSLQEVGAVCFPCGIVNR